MSKNNKKGLNKPKQKTAPPAPAVDTPKPKAEEKKEEKKDEVTVEKPQNNLPTNIPEPSEKDVATSILANEYRGMDPNRRADVTRMMFEYFHVDGGAAAKHHNVSQETIDKYDRITMLSAAAELGMELTYSKTPFALTMKKAALGEMAEALGELGITIPKKILELPANAEGNVEIKSGDVKVSADAKASIKKTAEARNASIIEDPTKITNEKELATTLSHYLSEPGSFFRGITKAADFYRAYKQIGASKEEAAKYKDMPLGETIMAIGKIVGFCPFVASGFGKHLFTAVEQSKSVVPAYTILRLGTMNSENGNPKLTEIETADLCKILIRWYIDANIAAKNKGLSVLKKDAKKNKVAIDGMEQKIKDLETIWTIVVDPDSTFADEILINRKATTDKDSKPEDVKTKEVARETYNRIRRIYYPEASRGGKTYVNLDENIQQHAGIITNMFRDPTTPLGNYTVGNLTDLVESKEPATEDQPAENDLKKEPAKTNDLGSKKK